MWGAIALLLSTWAVTVSPIGTTCPSGEAIAAELDRLGATSALAALGSPEITVKDEQMRVVLRGPDGSLLGTREVAAPEACSERATVAAVFIAAWLGAWTTAPLAEGGDAKPAAQDRNLATPPSDIPRPRRAVPAIPATLSVRKQGEVAEAVGAPDGTVAPPDTKKAAAPDSKPVPPSDTKAAASPDTATPSSTRAAETKTVAGAAKPPTRTQGGEVAGFGFGTYDGDAATFGGGLLVGYRPVSALTLAALFEATGERERTLGAGSAAYRTLRLGVGAGGSRRWGRVFGDLGIFPELTLLTLRGKNFAPSYSATSWGAAADLRGRFGIAWGRFAPFLFAGASYALRGEHLTLSNRPDNTTLSRWNVSAGAGLAFLFGAR
jgi:hypothetical protein